MLIACPSEDTKTPWLEARRLPSLLKVVSVNTDLAVFCMEADCANIPRENAKVKMMMMNLFVVDVGLSCFVM